MNRLSTFTMTGVALLCLGSASATKAETLKEQLVGSWSLVKNCEEFQDGKKNCDPLGPNLKGLLMFDANSFKGDEMSYKAQAPINSPQGAFVPNLEFKRIK